MLLVLFKKLLLWMSTSESKLFFPKTVSMLLADKDWPFAKVDGIMEKMVKWSANAANRIITNLINTWIPFGLWQVKILLSEGEIKCTSLLLTLALFSDLQLLKCSLFNSNKEMGKRTFEEIILYFKERYIIYISGYSLFKLEIFSNIFDWLWKFKSQQCKPQKAWKQGNTKEHFLKVKKKSRTVYWVSSKTERKRFRNVLQRDDKKCGRFKISKRMVQINQGIIGEHCNGGAFEVSDEGKKIASKS